MPRVDLTKLSKEERKEFDTLQAKDIDKLSEEELNRLASLMEAAGAAGAGRDADKDEGEKTPPKQGSSDTGAAGEDDDQEDLSGSKGDEDSFEAQQNNMAIGKKAGDAADGGKKRPADEDDGEKAIIKPGTPMKAEDIQISTKDFDKLFEGEDFSDTLREKAETLFKAVVVSKLNETIKGLNKQFQEALNHQIEKSKDKLEEQADAYLTHICKEWMEENEIAIDNGIRNEISESFINGLKSLFEHHYIEVPETKVDVVEQITNERDALQTRLNEAMAQIITGKRNEEKVTREAVLNRIAEGLAESQKERLGQLAEGLDYENEKSFTKKLQLVKESYFSSKSGTKKTGDKVITEDLDRNLESGDTKNENIPTEFKAYVEWLDKTNTNQ